MPDFIFGKVEFFTRLNIMMLMNRSRIKRDCVRIILKRLLILSCFISFFSQKVNATHAAGADLTYTCLGGLVYQVDATFYRDCGGSSEPGNVTITYKSASCAYARSVLANKLLINNGQEITSPCATAPSTCNGGITAGVRKWVYRTIITLPYACADWVFSYRICCRNCTVTTIQSPCAANSEIYVEATLNNILAPGNSSPVFNNMPVAFVCLGQNFNYNQGVSDVNGDSLSYELITPKISAIAEVTWLPPATTQAPLASSSPFTINPVTGDINFTPSAMQIGILAIRINEFRNGLLIGSTIRDMQVYTRPCFNTIPVASGMDGTTNYITSVCAGDPVCFNIYASDADSAQAISYSVYNPIAGSVITQTPGTPPSLHFCWTPTAADINRHPYVFTVTVNDDACPVNGVQTFSYTIFVNGPVVNVTAIDPGCSVNNGSATAIVINEPGCTFLWNTVPPQFTPTATNLGPGTYEVTVTTTLGCSANFNATLSAPVNSVTATCSASGVITCQSGNIGTADVTVTGGASPYTYLWNTGQTTSSLSGLGPGTYMVTVTDVNGCTASDTSSIQNASGMLNAIVVSDNVTCYGGNNGVAEVTVTGGTVPYTYNWNNGITTSLNADLNAGNYTVLITDANGCSATSQVVITQPAAPLSAGFINNDVSCNGGNNGELAIIISGGSEPYTYNWNNGQATPDIDSLTAGIYSVVVTDANGCTNNFTATVAQPASSLNITLGSMQPVSCYGMDNGVITLSVSGGTAPYNYFWSHGATSASIQNLEAGTYDVTVTDNNGCQEVFSASVVQPVAPLLGMTTIVSVVSCFGESTGELNLTVNGGTLPYSFNWSNGATTQNLVSVEAGTYQVTITDAAGCTSVANGIINQPPQQVTVTLSAQQILCYNGNNGSVTANASGGNGPYTYQWSNGADTPHISALTSGTYTVTVTDANGCLAAQSIDINEPASPLIPVLNVVQEESCFGSANGGITLAVSGGTAPYSYLWSNGQTSPDAVNLSAGNYTVTITDANGCNAIISETISGPLAPMIVDIAIENSITCYGSSDGLVNVNLTGGSAPFTYLWNTGSQQPSASGLTAGNYTVTVTDANNCSQSQSVELTQPASGIVVSGNVSPADCLNGGAGSIDLTISGGTSGYTFLWSNSSTTQDLQSLTSGIYTVTITDAAGCSVITDFEVTQETEFSITATGSTTICTGESVTLAADSVPGGTYQWFYDGTLLNGATGPYFSTPAAGVYSVSVTNSCGSFESNEIEVVVKSIGNVSVSNAQIICPPETAQLIATGGISYEWSPSSYITFTNIADPFVSPPVTTTYSVQIANEWGCKTSLTTQIAVVCDSLLVPTGFSPNSDGVNDGYVIDGIENYEGNKLWVYNRWGKLVYKARDYRNNWDGIGNVSGISMGTKVSSGTYYYILDLNDGSKPRAGYLIIRGDSR